MSLMPSCPSGQSIDFGFCSDPFLQFFEVSMGMNKRSFFASVNWPRNKFPFQFISTPFEGTLVVNGMQI